MLRKLIVSIIFLVMVSSSFATSVDVTTYVYKDFTIFNYVFSFDSDTPGDKFSMEKPKDAQIDYIVDKNGKVEYDEAGDYIIVKADSMINNTFIVKYTSKELSKEVYTSNSFRTYINFNFPVDELNFELILQEDFGEIISIFPQNYEISLDNKIKWRNYDINSDSLFIVNFKNANISANKQTTDYLFWASLIVPIIIIAVGVIFLFKKYKKFEKLEKKINEEEKVKEKKTDSENQEIVSRAIPEEDTFEEIINKHLTKNEKEVVLLIKNNEGISQFDILNHLPNLTKSNLSKIISKLHSKKMLKRIKVGKINNIYLGEKLSKK